jgi:hypothetical protein
VQQEFPGITGNDHRDNPWQQQQSPEKGSAPDFLIQYIRKNKSQDKMRCNDNNRKNSRTV